LAVSGVSLPNENSEPSNKVCRTTGMSQADKNRRGRRQRLVLCAPSAPPNRALAM
jgi:hypothetical protein